MWIKLNNKYNLNSLNYYPYFITTDFDIHYVCWHYNFAGIKVSYEKSDYVKYNTVFVNKSEKILETGYDLNREIDDNRIYYICG